MSSPRATAKARRPATNGKPKAAAKAARAKPKLVQQNELSDHAIRLAREIEREFAKSEDALSVEAMQTLMSALCRVYSAQVEGGEWPVARRQSRSVRIGNVAKLDRTLSTVFDLRMDSPGETSWT